MIENYEGLKAYTPTKQALKEPYRFECQKTFYHKANLS
jgi:hypothetical protein